MTPRDEHDRNYRNWAAALAAAGVIGSFALNVWLWVDLELAHRALVHASTACVVVGP